MACDFESTLPPLSIFSSITRLFHTYCEPIKLSEASASAFQDHSGLRDDVCFGWEFCGKIHRGLALLRIQPPMVRFFFAFDYTQYYSVHN